ncbi:MAG: hypothetical protein JO001_21045 [Alphaproteobacteria bacterium]|nr:hypothetical protein [Alphaproteobacteria bacterium]
MMRKTAFGLAFAAGALIAVGAMPVAQAQDRELITNGPQASGGDFGHWSAHRNVAESNQYERLLESNRGFREARIRKECGPITDPRMHQQCVASFHQDEPSMGSSDEPHRMGRGSGY